MIIELVKDSRHCTLSVQNDLLGSAIFMQVATRRFSSGKIGVWHKTIAFEKELDAKLFLFDIEVRYRSRGYT